MFAYISISLGEFTSIRRLFVSIHELIHRLVLINYNYCQIDSKIILGLCGVIIVALSVTASVGLLSFCGQKSTLIIVEVIPFLVLAIGVDNIFIMVQAFQRHHSRKDIDMEVRFGSVMESVAPSILLATLAESSCFFLGALTSMPAVHIFALNAGLALVMAFILQMLVFVPLLVVDTHRQDDNRYELFCCLKQPKRNEEKEDRQNGALYRFFEQVYAPLLIKDYIRIPVVSLET